LIGLFGLKGELPNMSDEEENCYGKNMFFVA